MRSTAPLTNASQTVADAARQAVTGARQAVTAAGRVAQRLRPGSSEGRRSLPIRRTSSELRQLWQDDGARRAVLAGLPVTTATLDVADDASEWGTTVTLSLHLEQAVPGMASQALTGKALRRFKALAETGEVPTTERNPSARADAGEVAG